LLAKDGLYVSAWFSNLRFILETVVHPICGRRPFSSLCGDAHLFCLSSANMYPQYNDMITPLQLMVPDWVPDFAFHPLGFDLNGAWGPSAPRIPDKTVGLGSRSTTEPQARIMRHSLRVISRTISQMNASLTRARQPLPFPNMVQYGP
jgi:hypothetical protein